MSNYDILTLQSETRRHIEFAIKTEFQKLFLSMVWEGVLKAEFRFY
jgi:hypothetical protein